MSRIRKITCLFVCALALAGCQKTAQTGEVLLYGGDKVSDEEAAFETTMVKKGTYKDVISATGSMYYTDENEVAMDEENAYLDKVLVKQGQKVKKGDVIAVYHIRTSKASLQKKKLLLDQAKSQYNSMLRGKESEVLAMEKSIREMTGESEKRIARIELNKLKKEYQQAVEAGKDVRQQEKEYNDLVRKQNKTNFKSPYSGTVVRPVSAAEFDGVPVTGEVLMRIRNESEFLIQTKGGEGEFLYNMTVEIGLGPTQTEIKHKLKGKVISTTNLSEGDDSDTDGQLIQVSDSDMKKYEFKKYNIYVTGVTLRIEDALMVDSKAVYEEPQEDNSTRLYVMLVENGKLHKRYIVSNYSKNDCFLAAQGVEEGQTLAILKQ